MNDGEVAVAEDESMEHVVENNWTVAVVIPLVAPEFTTSRTTAVESEALTMS